MIKFKDIQCKNRHKIKYMKVFLEGERIERTGIKAKHFKIKFPL